MVKNGPAMGDMAEIGVLRQNMSRLSRRAAVDEDFRRVCLADAPGAYLELTGRPLPGQYAIRFCEPDQELPAGGAVRWVRLPRFLPKTWLG